MIFRANILCFACCFWLAWVRPAGAAGDDYLVDVWTAENGLPDSSVTAVAQTPDGYLWLGTYNGLARFDGERFVTFDPANTPALMHARIRKLFLDGRGTLWINTYDGSLTTLRGGKFTLELRSSRLSAGDLSLISTSTNQVVFLTGRGDVFRKDLSTAPGDGWDELPPPSKGLGAACVEDAQGVVWYRDGDGQLWRLQGRQFETLPAANGLEVNCLAADGLGRVWIGTRQGISLWNGEAFQSVLPVAAEAGVTSLAVISSNQVWAVVNGGICSAINGQWKISPGMLPNIFSATAGRIGALEDHRGGMWFYNYGRGLLHVNAVGQIVQLTTEAGFPGDRVYCFSEDQEGNWWAGLDTAGLVRVRERQFHDVIADSNFSQRAAKTVCEDREGGTWIGLLSGGLARWQNSEVTYEPVTDSPGGGSVFCACPDEQGRLWLSAGDEDLFIREKGRIHRVTPVVHGVKAILAEAAGRVWIGTTTGLLVATNGSPEAIGVYAGLPRRNIRALAQDQAGQIWVGTGNGDLFRISQTNVTLFRPDDKHESGAIWSVLADADGTVWAGTFRGGLLRFRDGHFKRFTRKDGLPDNVICQILDDGRGNLWVGSHQGIFRAAKSALDQFAEGKIQFVPCIDYTRADGLPSIECSGGYQPAAWRNRAGQLWFATAKGVTWVQPEQINPKLTPPPVVIEEIVVDGRVHNLAESAAGEVFTIPPGRHQVEFRYTGLSLASPERVLFRYQLSRVDPGWMLAGTRRAVQYNLLPPGDYQFRVIACNSDGVWNETGAALNLKVLPHFYETWWFQAGTVLLLLGLVAIIVKRIATRRLRRQMEELERKRVVERERARIAKDIHDDLGASLTLIAVLGDLAQKEKSGERIEKMSDTAREAVKSLDEIVWAVNPRNDTLAHLIDYMGQFAVNYLRDAGIRCLLDVPEQAPVCEVPANVRHNVFLVVKEALQNIVKHAQATEVWLHVSIREARLRIAVEDNGRGFDRPPEDAWADGLRNMRQRLAEVGGHCEVESVVGKGTTIAIDLPLPTK